MLPIRRFCAEYPSDKKAANLNSPLALLQSTYYNQQMSSGLATSLQHLGPPSAALKIGGGQSKGGKGSQSEDGSGKAKGSQSERGEFGRLANELAVNEYGSCDRFDFREATQNPSAVLK